MRLSALASTSMIVAGAYEIGLMAEAECAMAASTRWSGVGFRHRKNSCRPTQKAHSARRRRYPAWDQPPKIFSACCFQLRGYRMSGECQPAADGPAGTAQRTVLVVEGEVVLRMAVSAHLRDAGFVVIEAVSADEAVEPVSANRAIQLVFSDVMMRGTMNGNELAAWISARYPEIRILLASGIHQHGPLSFVAKPYSFTELQQRIEGMLPDAEND